MSSLQPMGSALGSLICAHLITLLSDPPPELRKALVDLVEVELNERSKVATILIGQVEPPAIEGQRP